MSKKAYSEQEREQVGRDLLSVGLEMLSQRGLKGTTLQDILPVSYTHLDVYKRQFPLFAFLPAFRFLRFAYIFIIYVAPVSYTHLDVYKRQAPFLRGYTA